MIEMKRFCWGILSILLCFICLSNHPVEAKDSLHDAAEAYLDKISELEKTYGKLSIKEYPYGMPGEDWRYAAGLSYTSLIDFDGDGLKELFAVWHNKKKEEFQFGIFTYKKGKCIKLGQTRISGGGSPIIFWTGISDFEGNPCVVSCASSWYLTTYGVKDGKFIKYHNNIDTREEEYVKIREAIFNKLKDKHELNGSVKDLYTEGMGNEINKGVFEKAIRRTKKTLREKNR